MMSFDLFIGLSLRNLAFPCLPKRCDVQIRTTLRKTRLTERAGLCRKGPPSYAK